MTAVDSSPTISPRPTSRLAPRPTRSSARRRSGRRCRIRPERAAACGSKVDERLCRYLAD
jgi:hypothetical protein